ncbi:MAG: DUF3333 domain-containing protein, partial [Desulfatitalea sp.]|nr:DUF3333 domain-containing protein [Desulfatitalea sp.]
MNNGEPKSIEIVQRGLARRYRAERRFRRMGLGAIILSGAAYELRRMVLAERALIGTRQSLWLPADDDVDMLAKGHLERDGGRLSEAQLAWIDQLQSQGKLARRFNYTLFTAGDSREPELAGIWGAVCGSFYTLLVTLALSFPLGVATAVYLEEFAPRNACTDLIEVNINNLAAVPSIVFGL